MNKQKQLFVLKSFKAVKKLKSLKVFCTFPFAFIYKNEKIVCSNGQFFLPKQNIKIKGSFALNYYLNILMQQLVFNPKNVEILGKSRANFVFKVADDKNFLDYINFSIAEQVLKVFGFNVSVLPFSQNKNFAFKKCEGIILKKQTKFLPKICPDVSKVLFNGQNAFLIVGNVFKISLKAGKLGIVKTKNGFCIKNNRLKFYIFGQNLKCLQNGFELVCLCHEFAFVSTCAVFEKAFVDDFILNKIASKIFEKFLDFCFEEEFGFFSCKKFNENCREKLKFFLKHYICLDKVNAHLLSICKSASIKEQKQIFSLCCLIDKLPHKKLGVNQNLSYLHVLELKNLFQNLLQEKEKCVKMLPNGKSI